MSSIKSIRTFLIFFIMSLVLFNSTQLLSASNKTNENTYNTARKEFLKFTPDGFNKSIELYNNLIKSDPGFAKAYSGLSEVYSYLGNYKVHIKEDYEEPFNKSYINLKKALKLSPNSLETKRALATNYLHLRWNIRAKKVANSLISKYPSSPEAYYLYWSSTGKNPDSTYIKKSLELNPDFVPAHIELGTSYFYKKRNYRKAAEHYNKSLQIADSPQLRDYLGTTLRTQGRLSSAVEQYKKAITMDQEFALAYMNLGITKYYMRKYDDAIEHLNKAVAKNINHPESFYFLASSYEISNNRKLALQHYGNFLELVINDYRYRDYVQKAKTSYAKLSK